MAGFLQQPRSLPAAQKADVVEQRAPGIRRVRGLIHRHVDDKVEMFAANRDFSIAHADGVACNNAQQKRKQANSLKPDFTTSPGNFAAREEF